jgi:hypothetical protein
MEDINIFYVLGSVIIMFTALFFAGGFTEQKGLNKNHNLKCFPIKNFEEDNIEEEKEEKWTLFQ